MSTVTDRLLAVIASRLPQNQWSQFIDAHEILAWAQKDAERLALAEQQAEPSDMPHLTYEAPRDPKHVLMVRGVGRTVDEPRAVLVPLTERPTDDEIRSLHEYLRGWRLQAEPPRADWINGAKQNAEEAFRKCVGGRFNDIERAGFNAALDAFIAAMSAQRDEPQPEEVPEEVVLQARRMSSFDGFEVACQYVWNAGRRHAPYSREMAEERARADTLNAAISYAIEYRDGDAEAMAWLRAWGHGDAEAMQELVEWSENDNVSSPLKSSTKETAS